MTKKKNSGGGSINSVHKEIQRLDRDLMKLLADRARASQKLAKLRQNDGAPLYDLTDEQQMLAELVAQNKGPLDERALRSIFRELHGAVRTLVKPVRVAYLGPRYSYSHLAAIERFGGNTRARAALEHRYARPTLWDAFLHYLSREGYAVPQSSLRRDVTAKIEPSPELQSTLIELYRTDPKNAEMCERLVDLDEGIQEWRYRHVKMVQRTIGTKPGTGGSSGAQYLATTLMTPVFADLWEIRSRL